MPRLSAKRLAIDNNFLYFAAPTAAPQNITVDSYICENHIDVHWYPIPVDKRNGRLHEIQLNYKVMRNDFEGRLYSKVKEVSLSSSERHHRISGLKVNAVISLHMFGSTMGGSGVASSEYIGSKCPCINVYCLLPNGKRNISLNPLSMRLKHH